MIENIRGIHHTFEVMSRNRQRLRDAACGDNDIVGGIFLTAGNHSAVVTETRHGIHHIDLSLTEHRCDAVAKLVGDTPFSLDDTVEINRKSEVLYTEPVGFLGLGSKVTVIEFMKQILPPFDSDIAKRLKQTLSKRGVEIITGAAAKKIEQNEDYEIVVTYEAKGKEQTVVSTDLLMAVGRAPRVDGLNLEAAGVEYSAKGIPVDDNMRYIGIKRRENLLHELYDRDFRAETGEYRCKFHADDTATDNGQRCRNILDIENIRGIHHTFEVMSRNRQRLRIGDVNARMMLAHVATFQGQRALNAIEGKTDGIRFGLIPSAVFTVPECGMAGMTEDECKAKGIETVCGKSFYRANGKALAMGESEGLCKLVFDKGTHKLLGAHIMGADAALLAQEAVDLMNADATAESIREIVFGHPTLSEILLAAAAI